MSVVPEFCQGSSGTILCLTVFNNSLCLNIFFSALPAKGKPFPVVSGQCITSAADLVSSKSIYFSANSVVASCNKTTAVCQSFGRGQTQLFNSLSPSAFTLWYVQLAEKGGEGKWSRVKLWFVCLTFTMHWAIFHQSLWKDTGVERQKGRGTKLTCCVHLFKRQSLSTVSYLCLLFPAFHKE